MKKVLVVVDMQNDFIDGSLANKEAEKIIPNIVKKIESKEYNEIILTRDTHDEDYLKTAEGEALPIEHCIRETEGWCVHRDIRNVCKRKQYRYLNKDTFGIINKDRWRFDFNSNYLDQITIVGTCTDICVISNALILKSLYPETEIVVDASCCAGTSIERHKAALEIMKSCQIVVIEEGE